MIWRPMRRFILGLIILICFGLFYEFILVTPPDRSDDRGMKSEVGKDHVDNSQKITQDSGIVGEDSEPNSFAELWTSLKKGVGLGQNGENTEATAKQNTTEDAESQPQPDDAQKIKEYLIASSDIGFSQNTVELQLALHLAETGDLAKLIALIRDFEQRYEALKNLAPPPQVGEIHQKSLDIMGRFIQLLRDARDKKLGSVEATWNSPQRAAVISQSQEVVSKIRALIAQYNIQLPAEVLP